MASQSCDTARVRPQGHSEKGFPSSIHRRKPASQPATPPRKTSNGVLSPRLETQQILAINRKEAVSH
jgi:hypothetical protein